MRNRVFTAVLISGVVFTAGCEDIFTDDDDSSSSTAIGSSIDSPGEEPAADSGGSAEPAANSTRADTGNPGRVPSDFAGVRWLHTNVSGWPQTASLNAGVSGSSVRLNYNKVDSWPARTVNGTVVNANAWIFVYRNGTWYAATWEWLRPGQTSKSTRAVAGDHIKKSPLNDFS